MKKLVFIGIAAVSMNASAGEETGYTEKLKKETNWLIAEIRSVDKDLCSLISSKHSLKNEKTESITFAYGSSREAEPVIIESCDHCKELCTKGQSVELFV